jgi:hypothetical protein
LPAPSDQLEVVDRVNGTSSTDFGVPGAIPARDSESLTPSATRRLVSLVRAAWLVFDRVAAGAPSELRKGPRGGGRDRDKIVEHVYGGDTDAYAPRLGLRLTRPSLGDAVGVAAYRTAMLDALQRPIEIAKWPAAYAARRIAWHALDHAWEIEDRSAG